MKANINWMIPIAKNLQMCEHYLVINKYTEILCKKDNQELRTWDYQKCIGFFN